MRNSFSARLIVLLTLALALIMGGGMLLDYRFSREEILARLAEEARVEIGVAINDTENWLRGVQATTQLLGRFLQQTDYAEDGLQQLLHDVVANNDEIFGAAIALNPALSDQPEGFAAYYYSGQGAVRFANLASDKASYQDQPWFTDPIAAGKALWSEPYFDTGGGEVLMTTYSVPVYRYGDSGERSLYAVVTADVTLADLQRVVSQLHLGASSYGLLFSRQGRVMSSRNPASVMKHFSEMAYQGVDQDIWHSMFKHALEGEGITADFPCPESAGQCTIRMGRLESTGWPIGVVYNQREILAPLHRYEIKTAMLALGTLLLMSLTVYLLTSRLTRPLQQLSSASEHIARGNLDVPLPQARGEDEVSRLVRSFASMNRELKAYIGDLETATASRSRLEGELNAAREIQMSMLPGAGEASWREGGISLWAQVLPAKTVGGDLYTYFRDGRQLLLAVGDVSDKGVPAALFMARSISFLQQLAGSQLAPDTAMAKLNNALERDNQSCMFVTLFLGVLDLESGELCFASAGQTAPSLLRNGQAGPVSQDTGPALGLAANQVYPRNTLHLLDGDRLAIFTDGIDEAFDTGARMYGVERVDEEMQANAQLPLAACGRALIASVEAHAGAQPQSDDITLMLLEYRPGGRHSSAHSFSPGPGLASQLESWLQPLLQAWAVPTELVLELNLVAEELATNVNKYAGLDEEEQMLVTLALQAGTLSLEIRDAGRAFNPLTESRRSTLGADIDAAEIGGLGVHLITRLTDRQSYRREDGHNVLRVEKDIRAPERARPDQHPEY
ncbi:HAMP domain-containing protein [Seongchinamella sediminis]|uniref:HAMP domain-containing protein n=1 Tax=Seongchinamella sediminis TaxID=2283635 RepID=A0A3L7E126_9GAMM|nr:SpoIIE family protein phosphatase [Seongchinamella sediminis]RLQ23557.1 HAMP domain-containing protein [Seongchinamella sediminis]